MSWTRLLLEVRTPLFGGDDATGAGETIRVPSIRGALRHWFRAVAAGRGVTDRQELWAAEEEMFGSTRKPSRIALRVVRQPAAATAAQTRPPWAATQGRHDFDGAQYLLGQGLWDYRTGLRRPAVEPGETFLLDIRVSGDPRLDARFLLALRAWLTLGGLGARTRRGFGQVRCVDVVRGSLPAPWTVEHLRGPSTVEGWQQLGVDPLDGTPTDLPLDWNAPLDETNLPDVPTLAPPWWTGAVLDGDGNDLGSALHLAGLQWRWFRAGRSPEGDPDSAPSPDTRSPEWVQVIRGTGRNYPVAALGLPVGYYSTRNGRFFAVVTPHAADGTQLRRASPVWLRPVPVGDRWVVFTHVFFARLLPEGAELRITGSVRKTLPPPPVAVTEAQWDNWLQGDPRRPDAHP